MPSSRLHSHGFFFGTPVFPKTCPSSPWFNPRYDDLMSIQKSRIQRCRCLHRRIHRMCMRKSKLLICTARKKRGVRHPQKKVQVLKNGRFLPEKKVIFWRIFVSCFVLDPGFFKCSKNFDYAFWDTGYGGGGGPIAPSCTCKGKYSNIFTSVHPTNHSLFGG